MLRLFGMLGTAVLAGSLGLSPQVMAQSRAGWVDPPAAPAEAQREEAVPSKEPGATATASAPAPPSAPDQTGSTSATAPPLPKSSPVETVRAETKQAARPVERVRPKARALSRLQARRLRPEPARRLSAVGARGRLARSRLRARPVLARRLPIMQQRRLAQRPPARRIRSVQGALRSGFQVMRLRTIQFPDGRQVRILSRPDPRTLRAFLDED